MSVSNHIMWVTSIILVTINAHNQKLLVRCRFSGRDFMPAANQFAIRWQSYLVRFAISYIKSFISHVLNLHWAYHVLKKLFSIVINWVHSHHDLLISCFYLVMIMEISTVALRAIQLWEGTFHWKNANSCRIWSLWLNSLATSCVNINYKSFSKFKLIPALTCSL